MAYKNFKATEIVEEIGAELRKIRRERKQTISFVAKELADSGLHISNTLLGRMENGERRIDDEALNAICAFYGVDSALVVINASEEHIRRMSIDMKQNTDTSSEFESRKLLDLYYNLNNEGQNEVARLMRLMAYMEAFKRLQ